jgi:hypothetical protein
MSDETIEAAIQGKGLKGPRLTLIDIEAKILGAQYYVFPATTVTVCCLTLKNGYNVIGESAAVSPENFDPEIGRMAAYEHARDKIWALEGYLLKDQLSR